MKDKSGRIYQFGVGHYNESVQLVLWEDDGTRNLYLTIFYKDIPVGTVPLVNEYGITSFINGLEFFRKGLENELEKPKRK